MALATGPNDEEEEEEEEEEEGVNETICKPDDDGLRVGQNMLFH